MRKQGSNWMWIFNKDTDADSKPRLALFRGRLLLAEKPDNAPIQITADSRYKLYVNGEFVETGPARGNEKTWYVDAVDISPWLHQGENVVAVEVLRYPAAHGAGCFGVVRTETPGLHIRTELSVEWKCRLHHGFEIVPENPWFSPLMIYERVTADGTLAGWREPGYNDGNWVFPAYYAQDELPPILRPERHIPRPIPFLYRTKRQFTGISKGTDEWGALVKDGKPLTIPAHTTVSADLDAGELTTGYLRVSMAGGAGAKLTLLQAECYAGDIVPKDDPYKSLPRKGDRTDASLQLYGHTDEYCAAGYGTAERPECYEPYWFRAFRFIRVTVETGDEPLTLLGIGYEETGYPLEVRAKVKTSDPSMGPVWELCERSLRRCMHETYADCPFYERLQYAMDARSEILYTYAISNDDRLARKCMDDFATSLRQDGMVNCSAPNYETNVIPGFGIYFIGMVYDHMWHFGNRHVVQKHWDTVKHILDFFHQRLDERGLVGKIGDVNRPGQFWSFIDWTTGWDDTDGVPPATKLGPITMESLLYILGLQYAAELAEYLHLPWQAHDYCTEASEVKAAVNRWCAGEDGLYQDGPGIGQYSQHCQVFAALTETSSPAQGRHNLELTLKHPERFEQCSVAMCWYLFRALEKCGLYRYTDRLWNIWRQMPAQHLTTCPEDPLLSRSDCHGWGALALYELPAAILGVRPGKPGFEEIMVAPQTENLDWAEGIVLTPKGDVSVSWHKDPQGNVTVCAKGPEDVSLQVNNRKEVDS